MYDSALETWQGIRDVLDVLEAQHREPDPWESHFVAEAIVSLGHGHAATEAIDAARCPLESRRRAKDVVGELNRAITKADLLAAFHNLVVPGGHPA